MKAKAAHLFFCFLIVLLVGGCGIKTMPIPPQAVIPEAISDLKCKLDEKSATLSWSYPGRSIQGESIDNIRNFKIFKAEVAEEDYCPSCPIIYDFHFEINASRLKPRKKIHFSDTDLRTGYHYTYMVQSHSGWNIKSRDSNRVAFVWQTPLSAPLGLVAEAGDRLVTLNWSASDSLAQKVSYQILRSDNGKKYKSIGPPVVKTFFVDGSAVNGKTYAYKIRAIRHADDTAYPGLLSKPVSATPMDRTPPAPPFQVHSISTAEGVRIVWHGGSETDIGGYRIYRRSANKKIAIMIGESGSTGHFFTDKNLPVNDVVWYYSVTAVDQAEPANESEFSPEIKFDRRIN